MLDIRLTPAAEATYAVEAAARGQSIETFLNQTLPQEILKEFTIDDANYTPTTEEWALIQEGLGSLNAGKGIPHDKVWSKIDRI
jgi:hypothetical protein